MAAGDYRATIIDDPSTLNTDLDALEAGTAPFSEAGTYVESYPIWGGKKIMVIWTEVA